MIVLHSHSWVWAVLPPECRRVRVIGDPSLTAVLEANGFEMAPPQDRSVAPDAVLVATSSAAPDELGPVQQFIRGTPLAAVVLGVQAFTFGGPSRLVRGLEELASVPRLRGLRDEARRARGMLRDAGLQTEILPTSDRSRPYVIGPGSWRRLRRLPTGAVVVGSRGPRPESTLDRAVTAASSALGEHLQRVGVLVLESGKVLQELEDGSGRRFIQRVAGGPAALDITRSSEALRAIAGAGPPPNLGDRLMLPVCEGEVGLARFTVEPKAAGVSPTHMTGQLWEECIDFLVELHELRRDGTSFGEEAAWGAYEETLELLARCIAPARRPVLGAIAERLRSELGHVEVGWGHGDVWPENLLVHEGRLTAVLDWDGASRHALPLLDLLDLLPEIGSRSCPADHPGTRMTGALWPLLSSGDDARLRSYCDSLSIKQDRRHLQAFAVAYWLERVARPLQLFAARGAQPMWVSRNIEWPLSFLAAQGWA